MTSNYCHSQRILPVMKQITTSMIIHQTHSNQNEEKYIQEISDDQNNHLQKIIHKYRIQNLLKNFINKLKRNNVYTPPVQIQIKSEEQQNQQRWIKWKGVGVQYKWLQSLIIVGDIVMSLIIFYISVLQAFVQGFRTQEFNNKLIMILKIMAILFQFSKILLKSIKKQFIKGVYLVYITDILLKSTGIFKLLLYFAAILIILISMIEPINSTVGLISFFIAALKIFIIPQDIKILDIYYINSTRKQQYWDLIKVILFNLFFGHLIAGILIGMVQISPYNNWIITHNLSGQRWNVIYYWALYWSATLITTTGFGDYAATNQSQALIVGFLELFSSVVLVYNINLIGTIVMKMRSTDNLIEKKLAIFRRMNDANPINSILERKIYNYISFQNQLKELFQHQERQVLLKDLPEQLMQEYLTDVTQTIFKILPFFRHIRLETLVLMSKKFENKVYFPGQYLIKNKSGIGMIYILRNGAVGHAYHKLGSKMNGTIVEQLKSKSSIMSDQNNYPILLTNTFLNRNRQINYDILATEYSLIMKLKEQQFLQIIRKSDIDREHFFTIYDKHEINLIFKNQSCQYCQLQYHSKFQCSKLHYMPFKSLIIQSQIKAKGKRSQRISRYQRTGLRKEHCYYLRQSLFIPYQQINQIHKKREQNRDNSQNQNMQPLHNLQVQFLEKCEHVIRKVLQQSSLQQKIEKSNQFWGIDCQTLKNYQSYFAQSNPSNIIQLQMQKNKYKKSNNYSLFKTSFSSQILYQSNKNVIYYNNQN